MDFKSVIEPEVYEIFGDFLIWYKMTLVLGVKLIGKLMWVISIYMHVASYI